MAGPGALEDERPYQLCKGSGSSFTGMTTATTPANLTETTGVTPVPVIIRLAPVQYEYTFQDVPDPPGEVLHRVADLALRESKR